MNVNAAILWEQGAPLSVEAAELGGPRAGEVLDRRSRRVGGKR
jgi:Zn-dependent alcohol dehydrogenase